MPSSRWKLLRWFVSSGTLNVPQAGGPIAFSLVALSLTGETSGGAAMMLAMTLAQVVGAIPIARLGRSLPMATYLRLLVVVRTVALVSIAGLAASRSVLHLAHRAGGRCRIGQRRGPWLSARRAQPSGAGVAPAAGARHRGHAERADLRAGARGGVGLGTVSPVLAVLALALVGAVPALLVPNTGAAALQNVRGVGGSVLSPAILLWLACAAAGGATVAAIEIGAVALALTFGYEPALAIVFTVPLCLASVAGGIWVSVRNRMATRRAVVAQLFVMTLGSALVALELSVATTVVGTVLIGSVLAPLGDVLLALLDTLAPPQRRPEVFALLRTANATGVILASAVLTVVSLSMALIVVTGLMIVVTLVVGIASVRRQGPTPVPRAATTTSAATSRRRFYRLAWISHSGDGGPSCHLDD